MIHHGDPNLDELRSLGLEPDSVLDFSVCVNPYGPSPRVRAALADVSISQYPDRAMTQLRRALADWLATTPERILPGNGTSELIWLCCLAFLRSQDRVLVPEPTYGEYARAAGMLGARVVPLRVTEKDDFRLDAKRMVSELRQWQPRLVFLCNPSNPTGTVLPAEHIAAWAEQFPAALFVVDEAYLSFTEGVRSLLPAPQENVVVLRSMTKDFALAGLRLGFAVASVALVDRLTEMQPPWSVNAMSQAAGVAALQDLEHVRTSCELLRQARISLSAELRRLGLTVRDSAAHFILVKVGQAAAFRLALLRRGLAVRDCTSFGLPDYVRIAARQPEENARLVTAIAEVLR